MKRCLLLCAALTVLATPATAQEANWLPGVWSVNTLNTTRPAPDYCYMTAWASDRPGGAGMVVNNCTEPNAWVSNQGPQGVTGTNGTNGTNGTAVLSGSGAPSSGTGVAGDWYMDTTANRMYGPKVGSAWGSGFSVIGPQGIQGVAGPSTIGAASTRSLSLATAYQANDPSKPAIITINLTSTASLSLSGGTTITGEVRVGSANTVASGASGIAVGSYRNSLTGTLTIGLNIQTDSYNTITVLVPAGYYFAIRATAGTMSIVSVTDQAIG